MTSVSKKAPSAGKISFSAYFRRKWQLYFMLLIPAVEVLIFNYIPLAGLSLAFQDYIPGNGGMISGLFSGKFVGLKWFRMALAMPDFTNVLRNTVTMAVGKIVLGQVFALSLIHISEPTRP